LAHEILKRPGQLDQIIRPPPPVVRFYRFEDRVPFRFVSALVSFMRLAKVSSGISTVVFVLPTNLLSPSESIPNRFLFSQFTRSFARLRTPFSDRLQMIRNGLHVASTIGPAGRI